MTQQLHVARLPRVTEDGYFNTANANKSWVRVHGGQSSEFPIYPTTLERTITNDLLLRSNAPVITAKTGEHDFTDGEYRSSDHFRR